MCQIKLGFYMNWFFKKTSTWTADYSKVHIKLIKHVQKSFKLVERYRSSLRSILRWTTCLPIAIESAATYVSWSIHANHLSLFFWAALVAWCSWTHLWLDTLTRIIFSLRVEWPALLECLWILLIRSLNHSIFHRSGNSFMDHDDDWRGAYVEREILANMSAGCIG
jgi:hypothetical protein